MQVNFTGIGSSNARTQLGEIEANLDDIVPITLAERHTRIKKAVALMRAQGISALFLSAGSSLYYFTGLKWHASERMTAALITADGKVNYICPAFEKSKIAQSFDIEGAIWTWNEEDNPALVVKRILAAQSGNLALDETTPFFMVEALRHALPEISLVDATTITSACRMHKTLAEIALMQKAMNITLAVHKRAASILREGISTFEVIDFIDQAHRAYGGSASTFCTVSFAEATALPHGIDDIQFLHQGDMVLIDTGCRIQGYNSDITRCYVFGDATPRQIQIWQLEKAAQAAAFAAAQIGVPCEQVDFAARQVIENAGFGPGYQLPGVPHRTGHGIGLDLHEWTYLVKGNRTPLATGMCFSNEPMFCIEGEFGVRLEDHFYMSDDGPIWFTEPSHSIDDPFGIAIK